MAKTIEAILRIAADVSGGLAGLRQLRQESKATSAEVARATRGGRGQGGDDAAAEVAAAAAQQAQANRQRNQQQRQADAEALAQKKAAARAEREVERQAARERRAAEEAERRAKRRATADAERERQATVARQRRAEREEQRKLTQLAPQLTDVAVSLASGQSPAMVALQQGGQIRDLYGGLANAGRALLATITPMRVIVGGIGAGLALWVTQLYAGYRQSEQLRRTLALTGNAIGTSQGQVAGLARSIATETETSIGFARDLVTQLLTVSGQTQVTLGATGRAAAALAKLTGQSAEEAIKAFDDQANGVTDWAVKANRAYNFLTAAQVAYVRRLESEGRTQEAVRFVNNQLADSLVQRTAPALGTLERAWSAVTRKVSEFIDQLRELGRDKTPEQRISEIQKRLAEIAARQAQPLFAGRRKSTDQKEVDALNAELQTLLRDQQRGAERAAEARQNQEDIRQQSKEVQQSITAVVLAEAQKRLQGQLAALDKQQQAVELADAQGLISAREKALALNRIEQQRLRAQVELQQRQAQAARGAVGLEAKPEDRRAAEARAIEAEAQLIATRSRLTAAVAEARNIVEADDLAKSRERAQAWAEVWQRAADRVRELTRDNANAAAGDEADPVRRAEAAARVRTQDLQRSIDDTARDLKVQISLAVDPRQRAELERLLAELQDAGATAVGEAARDAALQSLRDQSATQLERLKLAEQEIADAVERRTITSEEGERRVFAAREAALPQLLRLLELQKALARTDAERAALEQLEQQLKGLGDRTTELRKTLAASATQGLASNFVDFVTKVKSAGEAVRDFTAGFARSMLDLISRRLAEKLVNDALKALEGAGQGGGGGSWWGTALQWIGQLFVTSKHTGGVIDGARGNARRVAPWIFQGAQVLHSGGLAGLMANEVPAILERGEEVLTADDPRHRNNLRGGVGGPLIGNFNVSVNMDGVGAGQGDEGMARRLAAMLKNAIEQKLADEMRPGGMLQNVARG